MIVADYISEGVIAKECGFTRDSIEQDMTRWEEAGQAVCRSLEVDGDDLGEVQQQRVYQYYLPIFFWVLSQLQQHTAAGQKRPLVVRVSHVCLPGLTCMQTQRLVQCAS
jgi:hypothetical protein